MSLSLVTLYTKDVSRSTVCVSDYIQPCVRWAYILMCTLEWKHKDYIEIWDYEKHLLEFAFPINFDCTLLQDAMND